MSADTDPDRGAFLAGMPESEYARRHQNPTPHSRTLAPGTAYAFTSGSNNPLNLSEQDRRYAVVPEGNVLDLTRFLPALQARLKACNMLLSPMGASFFTDQDRLDAQKEGAEIALLIGLVEKHGAVDLTVRPMRVEAEDTSVEALREAFLQRCQHGINKYGVTTDRTDLSLDDWLQHALEEAMDFCVYLQRAKKERAMRMDLDQIFLRQMEEAVKANTWMPPEYMANDWQADVIQLLRYGPGNVSLPEIYHNGGVVPKSDKPVPATLRISFNAAEIQEVIDHMLKNLRFQVADIEPALLTMLKQTARFDDNSAFNETLQRILDSLGSVARTVALTGEDPNATKDLPQPTYWYRRKDDAIPGGWFEWKQCDYATYQRHFDAMVMDDEDNDVEVKIEPKPAPSKGAKKTKAVPQIDSIWECRDGGSKFRVTGYEEFEDDGSTWVKLVRLSDEIPFQFEIDHFYREFNAEVLPAIKPWPVLGSVWKRRDGLNRSFVVMSYEEEKGGRQSINLRPLPNMEVDYKIPRSTFDAEFDFESLRQPYIPPIA